MKDETFRKTHDREYFYKYLTPGTSKIVLQNETFRWSSPLIFNDPFDIQGGFHWDLDLASLADLFLDRLEDLVNSDESLVFKNALNHSEFIEILRRARRAGIPIDKDRFREIYRPIYQELADYIEGQRVSYVAMRGDYLTTLRILCVCEEPDNVLMWSHYADNHKGIVLKLKVAESAEDDDPLWLARPVKYLPISTPFSGKNFVDEFLGLKANSLFNPGDYWVWAHEKFDVWDYEKEWRVCDPSGEGSNGFIDSGFRLIKKIEAIYFGCRCSENDKSEIVGILKAKNPSVQYFQALKHPYEYQLEFEELEP